MPVARWGIRLHIEALLMFNLVEITSMEEAGLSSVLSSYYRWDDAARFVTMTAEEFDFEFRHLIAAAEHLEVSRYLVAELQPHLPYFIVPIRAALLLNSLVLPAFVTLSVFTAMHVLPVNMVKFAVVNAILAWNFPMIEAAGIPLVIVAVAIILVIEAFF